LTGAYDINHCIYCDKKDFKSFEEVLKHIKAEHDEQDREEAKTWGDID